MADVDIQVTDNTDQVLKALNDQVAVALEKVGLTAERFAKTNITNVGAVDTGNLRNSITHQVDDNVVYIGTNVEYAAYVELGTGKYYPGGRDEPWGYEDAKGDFHWTAGMKGRPYLKPAVEDHAETYRKLIKNTLSGSP